MIRKTKSSNVMNIFKITVTSGFPKYKKRAQIMYRNLYLFCPRSLRQNVKIHGGFTLGRADADIFAISAKTANSKYSDQEHKDT